MKKSACILTISILLLSITSKGQTKIDDIKNDSDVVRFVEFYGYKYNKKWKNVALGFDFTQFSKHLNKEQIYFTDSVGKQKWIVSDFNGDGKNDLIFYGRIYYTQAAVIAFISEPSDSISCTSLGNILTMSYPSSIYELKMDGRNLLQLGVFYKRNVPGDWIKSFESDTLIYKYGGFVEYRESPGKVFEFDSIIYKTSSPWGNWSFPSKMTLYSDGTIKLYLNNTLLSGDSLKYSKAKIEQIENLKAILGYVDFPNLNSEYSLYMVSDLTTATTEVYYKGKMKGIEDYGMHGTYGLSLLYAKFYEIMSQYRERKK